MFQCEMSALGLQEVLKVAKREYTHAPDPLHYFFLTLFICVPVHANDGSSHTPEVANDLYYCGIISEFYGTVSDEQLSSQWQASKDSFFRLAHLLSDHPDSLLTNAVVDRFRDFVNRLDQEEMDDRAIKNELSVQYARCVKLVDALHGEFRERVFQAERTILELAQTTR